MKSKNIVMVVLLLAPVLILANSGHHVDPEATRYFKLTGRVDDFWQRVINFSIFAVIIYYLVANPIKDFFKGRSEDISNKLKEIEIKLQESKKEEELAQKRLIYAQEKAKEIVADGELEAKILAENIIKKNSELLSSMEKHLEEKMEIEKKKIVKDTIKELLENGIDSDDIAIDSSKVVSLISKKVA
jgi:F-type H+-transporting ATPase subunit b